MRRGGGAWTAALLAVFAAGACGRAPEPRPAAPPVTTPAPPVTPAPDVTPKATVEGAGATSTHESRPDPLRPMTKAEESVAMPKPGQANDHSNPAAQPVQAPQSEPAR